MPDAARHRAKARRARTPATAFGCLRTLAFSLGGLIVTSALPGCTHDFSVFDVSAEGKGDGSVPGGKDAGGSGAGGAGSSAGGSGTGGAGTNAGGAGTAGVPSNGGTAGASASGGAPASGGTAGTGNSGGQSNAGGTPATGGKAATGGVTATGGRPATGGRAGTGGAGPLPTCAQKYGTASGYVLCTETATTCRFFANTANSTCDALCTGLRGTCSDQDNDDGVNPCTVGDATDTCATPRQNAICVCAR